jgi:hypothetical protein
MENLGFNNKSLPQLPPLCQGCPCTPGHAPWGILKEKSLGSGFSIEKPHLGQASFSNKAYRFLFQCHLIIN